MKRFMLLIVMGFAFVFAVKAQDARFKSLYMYHFTKYIQWPEKSRQGDFVIGVVGNTPVYGELKNLTRSRHVGGQNLKVIKIYGTRNIPYCHVLYVTQGRTSRLSEIINEVKGRPTLIITEAPGMASRGSSINYVKDNGKLKFEINTQMIADSNLKVHNELVKLGIAVK